MKKRYWHIGFYAAAAATIFEIADRVYGQHTGKIPDLTTIWWLSLAVPMICGAGVTLGCGGAGLLRRIIAALGCGALAGALYTGISAIIGYDLWISAGQFAATGVWRMFVFSIFAVIGVIITELKLTDPDIKKG